MVIDTSAIMAIVLAEPGYLDCEAAIESDSLRLISAASVLECLIVCTRRQVSMPDRSVDNQILRLRIYPIEISLPQLAAARQADRRFGKGIHPAALNFGDCFSYALAKIANEPLLFKGADFSQTDIVCCLP